SDAVKYCNARSQEEDLEPCYNLETWECNFNANGYRLPTEAEWEYACRAGTSTDFYWGDSNNSDYHWNADNSESTTHPVGQMPPNNFGLYDMIGNVFEWGQDWFGDYSSATQTNPTGPTNGNSRVFRGGGWSSPGTASSARSGNRDYGTPSSQGNNVGFRCVKKTM
ncbi:hypothetical protein LCGC14_1977040, partial [marine sediment metagenome]